jgi:iron complex outermembrane receptor protein
MKNYNKLKIAIIATLGVSVGSQAQITDSKDFTLEKIEVTAQKRVQSLQDIPIAMTALRSDDLDRLNATSLGDIQYSTPNLTVSTNNRSNPRVGLRGVSDYSRNPGYDNRVSVYVDGIYVGRSAASNQATLDLERIEVLRGPQGTLFGKNTVAGAISLTTKRPGGEFNGFVEGNVGNYGYTKLTGMVNGALIDDKLYGKLMVNDTQRDGHVKNLYNGEDLNGLDDQSLRMQLRWVLDYTEVNFTVDYDEHNADFHGREAVDDRSAPNKYEVAFNNASLQYVELFGLSGSVEHELNNGMGFTSLTGYRDTNFQNSADEDYGPIDWVGNGSPFQDATSAVGEESKQFSQEFRLSSAMNDTYDYVAGLYYFDQTNKASTSAGVANNLVSVSVPAEVDVKSYAAFIHGNYWFSKQLQFTGGLRYTYEEKSIDFSVTDTTGLFTNGSIKDERNSDDFSPKLGLNYFIKDGPMLYTSYSKGFKSGGWNADFVESLDGLSFDDEEVDSLEAGLKSTFWDDRARLNASIYHSNYSNFQVQQFVELPNGITDIILTNAGEVTAKGFEADLNVALTETFTVWLTYGYTDSKFDSFKDGGGAGIDYDGNLLPDAPKQSFGLGLQGRYPILDNSSLIVQLDWSYRDEFFTNPSNTENTAVDAYDRFNARIGVESEDGIWSLFLWGKNLADSDDVTYRSRSFLGINREVYMEPRMFGLSLKYKFGDFN